MAQAQVNSDFSKIRHVLGGIDKGAWLRFFVAIAGLLLAFCAAIFSTIARQQGNFFASALLASAALLMAGSVGLFTVPYLARRAALESLVEAIDYDVTREGILYLALTLVISIAALNTGNNLLFIVVSAMIAAVAISGIVSTGMLRGLELDLALPAHVFAGDRFTARLALMNLRRWTPAFSISVVTPKQRAKRRPVVERSELRVPLSTGMKVRDWNIGWRREERADEAIFTGSAYFPFIPPRISSSAEVELRFAKRGLYTQDAFGISTRFPFSFLMKTRRAKLERELIVFPPVEPTDEALEILPLITGEFESFVRGRGNDLYRIRDYMPEDSARHVDWKATARSGSLKVREFTREDDRKIRIVFDNPTPGQLTPQAYESAVALAASLSWHFANENAELSFVAPGYPGEADIKAFLRYLALVQPAKHDFVMETLSAGQSFNLILTTRSRGTIRTDLWNSSYVVFLS